MGRTMEDSRKGITLKNDGEGGVSPRRWRGMGQTSEWEELRRGPFHHGVRRKKRKFVTSKEAYY